MTRLRLRLSLRMQLIALVAVLMVGALTISGVVTTQLLRQQLLTSIDDQLRNAAPGLLRFVFSGRRPPPGQGVLPTDFVVQVNQGGVAERTADPSSSPADLPVIPAYTAAEAAATAGETFTLSSADGRVHWRLLALPLTDLSGSVVVGLPTTRAEQTIDEFRGKTLLVGGAVVLIGALLGSVAIRRAFRPLGDAERTAAAIAAGDLSRRVRAGMPGTEVGRLSAALNGMLSQIEDAFGARTASEARMRRFVADASHELRTPLAAIRGFAELYRQGAVRDPDDVARAMGRIESEATRLGVLVESLLTLARMDEARSTDAAEPSPGEEVDLVVLAADAVQDARALAPERRTRLVRPPSATQPGPVLVRGDEAKLRQVLTNLVGNALHHTPPGSPVEVAVAPADGGAVVEVRDHGLGVPAEHHDRVFERFYRVDSSRTRVRGGGAGLGLAIVAAVVAAHRGRVEVRDTVGGGATFRVWLPVGRPPSGQAGGRAADLPSQPVSPASQPTSR